VLLESQWNSMTWSVLNLRPSSSRSGGLRGCSASIENNEALCKSHPGRCGRFGGFQPAHGISKSSNSLRTWGIEAAKGIPCKATDKCYLRCM